MTNSRAEKRQRRQVQADLHIHIKVKIVALLITCMLLITAMQTKADERMNQLTIPFSPKEVGHCYERLKQTLPVYQKGISDIRSVMESNDSFEKRLKKVSSLHAGVLKESETQESPHSWNEVDIYLCCLYDMMEAMYASEAEKIASGPGSLQEKQKKLNALAASIDKLPFGSPQYDSGIRPRLERAVLNVSKKLEGQK